MDKNVHFLPAYEKGHFDGLVDEGEYLRQSLLYKQILPRTQSRQKTICVNPVNLVKKTWCLSVFVAKTLRNLRNLRLIKDLSLYYCREKITNVMGALQIATILTNKANFPIAQMTVSDLLTTNYEQRTMNYEVTNKANSNPIQTQYKADTKPIRTQFKPNQTQNKPNFGAK